ncbi:glycosyltransferase [Microbacterium resistens]|uniref:Glycosyltransferase n=2 Tax=Microbacterium resistens TaxID=156977 RepID=A0ABY3RVG9_9MICO|nr:glycosyltransferase [Microbacterium resistens]UGS28067.1 glycosyltransferase [Microbacterium resistens]
MPARVHAILVTRTSATSLARVLRTLDALSAQTLPPAALTIVVCGSSAPLRGSAAVSRAAEAVIETRANATLAAAVGLAAPRVAPGSAVWILTDDTVPEPSALERLSGALERSPSAAAAAPKLVGADDPDRIVSFGQTMTRYGRAVDPAAGEYDQGQHDGTDDALGADVRGMLIRAERQGALRPDPGLGGADEGLDIGVRARLSGGRVVLTADARVAVVVDPGRATSAARAFEERRAQLHRRLVYAPAAAVPLHWLSLLPLALWRSVTHLVGKRPAAVAPEWGAAALAMVSGGAVAQSRRALKAGRAASWASLAPLRMSRAQFRQRLDDGHGSEGGAVQELGFFSRGGAWAVLAALVVSVVAFASLLAWPALGGGALLPLRQTVAALWRDAAYGQRGLGVEVFGPADPFAGVVALLGTLWPGAPSYALVLLWVAALPLAVLGAWFAATRLTDRAGLRIFAAAVWALSPPFVIALAQGRPAAVIAHLLLPWVFHAGLVAHRSWGAAGAASLLIAGVLACAPSLAPALVLLWLVAIVILLARRSVRGAVRVLWTLIPAVVVFAPLVLWQLFHGETWAIFADPGATVALPQAGADAAGRLAIAAGLPTNDDAGWAALLGTAAPWALWLAAPLAVLALLAPVAPRWSAGILSVVVAAAGLATAFLAVGVAVSFAQSAPVAIWPGTGLSLAWAGALAGALVTLDSLVTLPSLRRVSALVAAAAIAVCAVPSLTAVARGTADVVKSTESTLPAFINAQARDDQDLGTLVLTPQPSGGLGVEAVWGASQTLGAQTTLLSTATEPRGRDLSELAVDLVSSRAFDAPSELSALGIRYVLLNSAPGEETDAARALRLEAVTALDQRAGFLRAGNTDKGALWRMEAVPAPRAELPAHERSMAQLVVTVQLVILLAALLLAIPTRASRRAARGLPRAVGLVPERQPLPAPEKPERPKRAPRNKREAKDRRPAAADTAGSAPLGGSGDGEQTVVDPARTEPSDADGDAPMAGEGDGAPEAPAAHETAITAETAGSSAADVTAQGQTPDAEDVAADTAPDPGPAEADSGAATSGAVEGADPAAVIVEVGDNGVAVDNGAQDDAASPEPTASASPEPRQGEAPGGPAAEPEARPANAAETEEPKR